MIHREGEESRVLTTLNRLSHDSLLVVLCNESQGQGNNKDKDAGSLPISIYVRARSKGPRPIVVLQLSITSAILLLFLPLKFDESPHISSPQIALEGK